MCGTGSGQVDELGNGDQNTANQDPDQEDLSDEAHPAVIRDVGCTDQAHQRGRGGEDIVAEAVAEVEGQDDGLTGHANQIGHRQEQGHHHSGLPRAGSHKDVEHSADQEHSRSLQHGGDQIQTAGQHMDNGVHDAAVRQDQGDGTGGAHDHDRAQHSFAAGHDALGDVREAFAGQQAHYDAQPQEHGREFRHIPVQLQSAIDNDAQGDDQGGQDGDPASGQLAEGGQVGGGSLHLALKIQIVHGAELGIFLDLHGVADEEQVGDDPEHHQADGAVPDPGEGDQTRDLLGQQGGAGLQRAGRKAHSAAQQNDGHTHQGVKPQCEGQHDGDGDEGDKQVHALIGGDQSKDQGEHGDEDIEAVGEFPGHLGDGRLEGAALGNQVECAAREHQHEDQVSGVHEAVDDIVHNLQGVDWRVFDIVEALRIDQIPSGDCVLKTHIGAGRHDPGKQDRRKNDHKNNLKESDLSQYKKNEDGLYPWEVDQDDSPKRIEPNASRYVNQARPRRGRW